MMPSPELAETDGFVYVLHAEPGYFKFGYSMEPEYRAGIISSRTHTCTKPSDLSPGTIKLIGFMPANPDKEREIHSKLSRFQSVMGGREWFHVCPETEQMVDFILGQDNATTITAADAVVDPDSLYAKRRAANAARQIKAGGGNGGRPRSDTLRCPCGVMTAIRAATRKHKCG